MTSEDMIMWGISQRETRHYLNKQDLNEILNTEENEGKDNVEIKFFGKEKILLFNSESEVSRWLIQYWPSYVDSSVRRFKFGQKPVSQIYQYTIKKQKIQIKKKDLKRLSDV